MPRFSVLIILFTLFLHSTCKTTQPKLVQLDGGLALTQLAPDLYIHTSPLRLSSGETFPCNGLVFIDHGEAIVFDTPVDDEGSKALIDWLKKEQKVQIKAVVPTHFHIDCLGGLGAFHRAGVTSYAHAVTFTLAKASAEELPKEVFESNLSLRVGREKIECWHPGEAHTKDNIVAWVPSKKALFGGCMLKAKGAGKGNLADANVATWSESMQAVKDKYSDLQWAVPGHGAAGGMELLDFTIQMFAKE